MAKRKSIKGISKESFNKFTNEMWKRLKMGEKKYGTEYLTADIKKELIEELEDASNYIFMLYLKLLKINKK